MKYFMMCALALVLSGCGKAPDLTDLTTSTVASIPNGPTTAFTYPQAAQICNALKAWNPLTTSIQFPGDPGNLSIYLFTENGITQNGGTLTTDVMYIGTGGAPLCTVTISNGKMTSCI